MRRNETMLGRAGRRLRIDSGMMIVGGRCGRLNGEKARRLRIEKRDYLASEIDGEAMTTMC